MSAVLYQLRRRKRNSSISPPAIPPLDVKRPWIVGFFVDEKRWADSHGTFWRFWADLERIWGLSEVDVRREEKVEAFGGEPGSRVMP
jgi:hypothetical protein